MDTCPYTPDGASVITTQIKFLLSLYFFQSYLCPVLVLVISFNFLFLFIVFTHQICHEHQNTTHIKTPGILQMLPHIFTQNGIRNAASLKNAANLYLFYSYIFLLLSYFDPFFCICSPTFSVLFHIAVLNSLYFAYFLSLAI